VTALTRDRWVSFWLALLLGFVYLVTYSGMHHSVDEMSVLSAAETLLAKGGWHINQMEWEQSWRPSQAAVGLDGNLHLYKRGLAVTALILPWLAAGQRWGIVGAVQVALLVGPLVTALTGAVLYWIARRLGFGVGVAALAALAWGLGTLAWPYSRTLFTEPTAALGLSLALYGAITFRRAAGRRAAWALILAGSGLALLTLAKQANAVVGLPLVVYLAYVAFGERRDELTLSRLVGWLLAFGVPLGVALAAILAYNHAFFGTLFTPPFDRSEGFTTPLLQGLSGLLLSPGKGVLWYAPLTWLALASVFRWRDGGRLPDFLLVLGMALSVLMLYGAWSDWAGGRSWGPRFLTTVMPAVALMALPALDGLVSRSWPRPARIAVLAVLALTVIAQFPGVLVSFSAQEGLDVKTGLSLGQLRWTWTHSPLVSYWQAIGSSTTDPVLAQRSLWEQHPARMIILLGLGSLGFALAIAGLRRSTAGRATAALGAAGLVVALALGVGLPVVAANDPRWEEASADPTENRDLMTFIEANAGASDLVLLDLIPYYDITGRTWLWMNRGPVPPQYVGWLRRDRMQPADADRLQRWLQPFGRAWLSLEGTAPGAAESTTEAWLDRYGYRGRHRWVGTQRVIEYILAPEPVDGTVVPLEVHFGDGPVLKGYSARQGRLPGQAAVRLLWDAPAADALRFSVQALDRGGKVLAGIDRRPGELPVVDGYEDRVGLAVGTDDYTLTLRVYDSASGTVLSPSGSGDGQEDHVVLSMRDGVR
jgi:hypothetical protein